jgi:hypothetical protein|tara:strand:- start:1252 stop:1392 length:141 start_codon:yes stop_codon:yes gene_type:complete
MRVTSVALRSLGADMIPEGIIPLEGSVLRLLRANEKVSSEYDWSGR